MASFTDPAQGVGPHPKPWPNDSRYDTDLLSRGDSRNVIDKYRYWSNQAIVDDLAKQRFDLEIAIENLEHDFNIGAIVRNANAFNVRRVHIIGRKQWNKRGAMVTNRYLDVVHHRTINEFLQSIEDGYHLIAIDNQPGAKQLHNYKLPAKTVLIFGGEGPGISQKLLKQAEIMLEIEQFGSTRSINVGVASGIAMYAWIQRHVLK